jgi:O-antigen ligase
VTGVAHAAGVVGCLGLALLVAARDRRLRIAGLAAWGLGMLGLVAYLAPDTSTTRLVAAGAGGLVLAVAGAALLLRYPYLLAFATLACLPARIPVEVGGEDANLLLPLYGVIGAYALALGWQLVVRRDDRVRELGPVTWPVAAVVAWTGITILWTVDLRQAAITLGAFVLPFGLLALGFARLPWRGRWLAWLWAGLVGTALAYAAVGLYQWATREVFWNPKVEVGNAYAPFFRVNSVFWDPSIYGRYLVVGILTALAGILLGGVRGPRLAGLYVVVVLMWCGLLLSYSQSSFVALAAGTVAAAFVIWRWRAVGAAALLALVVAAGTLALPQARGRVVDRSQSGIDDITSGRASLVGQGVRIALHHPVGGVGVGGFKRAYADRVGLNGRDPRSAVSHTTPVTVAAEGGIVGFALYVWLLVAALGTAFLSLGRGFTSRVSLAVGLTLTAIAVHSLFYGAFFEDPLTWAMLGLVALAASVPRKGLQ